LDIQALIATTGGEEIGGEVEVLGKRRRSGPTKIQIARASG
jgi:hypothetical protein